MQLRAVAPFTGAWIEINSLTYKNYFTPVAPFTGAWIEIVVGFVWAEKEARRSLHGSVD